MFSFTEGAKLGMHQKEADRSTPLPSSQWVNGRNDFENSSSEDSSKCHCERKSDPFLPENRIPLPKFVCGNQENENEYNTPLFCAVSAPATGRRRNERERQRVRSVNEGFERLRRYLPQWKEDSLGRVKKCHRRRHSKVDVLRAAISYIRHLQGLLDEPADLRETKQQCVQHYGS